MKEFNYKGWNLDDAVDALMAYDHGCTDSGVKDDAMKSAVREYLHYLCTVTEEQNSPTLDCFRLWASRFARERCLTEERLQEGYGIEDVKFFLDWLDDELDIQV